MTRQYARVRLRIWGDDDFLDLSAQAQALYFKLLTHPTLSLCGVADWRPKRLAALSKGMNTGDVEAAGRELAEKLYIAIDSDTEEVLIRSFIRNDETLKNPKASIGVGNDYGAVTSRNLRGIIVHELKRLRNDQPELKGFNTLSDILSEHEIDPMGYLILQQENWVSDGVSNGVYDTQSISFNHKPNLQPTTSNPRKSENSYSKEFEEWYSVYPKKADKKAASKAFETALRTTTLEKLIDGARKYRDDPNRTPQFTKNPATWLNKGSWENEPLPIESTQSKSAQNLQHNQQMVWKYMTTEERERAQYGQQPLGLGT